MMIHLRVRSRLFLFLIISTLLSGASQTYSEKLKYRIGRPAEGKLYHGVFPGGKTGDEDDITLKGLKSYQESVGNKTAWVYFSHNWFKGRQFPVKMAKWIRKAGAIPFIRLMLRSTTEQDVGQDKLYTLQAIIDGTFDKDLKQWARDAKAFGTPLLVEYGTECNGEWFQWNGKWNGGGKTKKFGDPKKPDGPERFAAAFRHIVLTMREEGADNITWVFHVDSSDYPEKKWNRLENYYPGDDVVDWVGVSVYGPGDPMETEAESFRELMDSVYPRLEKLAPDKPVAVLEFGCTAGSKAADPAEWAGSALDDLFSFRWPRVIGFAWWNERWENDDNPKHDTTMRVQDIPGLAKVFRDKLNTHADKLEH